MLTIKQPIQSESDTQKQVIELLIKSGWLVIRVNSGRRSGKIRFYIIVNSGKSDGLTDLIAFKNGKHIFIEMKKHGKKQTDCQIEFSELAKQHGEVVYCFDSIQQVIDLIKPF